MSEVDPVYVYKPSGDQLTMDGEPATLQGLVAVMHKATHAIDGLDVPVLVSNLNEVLTLSDDFDDKLVHDLRRGHPALSEVSHVDGFEIQLEGGYKSIVTFAHSDNGEYVFAQLQFKLSSTMFSSIEQIKKKCLEGIFRLIHSQYGDSKNVEIGLGPPNPDDLIFGDSETLCTVSEERQSGVFSSSCHISVSIWNSEFWNPTPLEMEAFIR